MKIGRAVYCNTEDGIRVGQVIGILKDGQNVAGETIVAPAGESTGLYVQFDKEGEVKAFIPEGKAHKVRDGQAEQFVRDIVGVELVGGYTPSSSKEADEECNDSEEEETCEECGEYESECVCD